MQLFRLGSHEWIQLDDRNPLGCGGEGRVFAVAGNESLAAKLYDVPEKPGRAEKLRSMLKDPPLNPMTSRHVPIAWPLDLLATSPDTAVVGYLMPRIRNGRVIDDYYNPPTRLEECPLFHYEYLLCAARNLAAAVHSVHKRGYVVGDVKQSNILVTPSALVSLVDTDSFQVVDAESGHVYRCPVGTPEYTPPELQGATVSGVLGPEHDLFGLAVLIFQLLMEGSHPFAGVYRGDDDPPPLGERIRLNHFPYLAREPGTTVADADNMRHEYDLPAAPPPLFSPGRKSVPFHVLAPELRALFLRCFSDGYLAPRDRPAAQTWLDALDKAKASLLTCGTNSQHRYGEHLDACPWCARMATQLRGSDPFPSIEAVKSAAVTQPPLTYLQPGISVPPPANLPEPLPMGPPDNRSTFGITSAIWATGVMVLLLLGGAFTTLNHTSNPEPTTEHLSFDPTDQAYRNGMNYVPTYTAPSPSSSHFGSFPYLEATARREVTTHQWTNGLLSPGGRRLLVDANTIAVEDAITGENRSILPGADLQDVNGSQLAFSDDGLLLAVGNSRGIVAVWNDRKHCFAFKKSIHKGVHALAFAPDGRSIAVSRGSDGAIDLLSAQNGIHGRGFTTQSGETPYLMAFTPDGKRLIVATSSSADVKDQIADVKMYCMDVVSRKTLWEQNLLYVTSVAVSPDNGTIAVGGTQLRLLSAENGDIERVYADSVDICAFSPTGIYLAVKNERAIQIFRLADLGPKIGQHQDFSSVAPLGFAFGVDGVSVVSIDKVEGVTQWKATSGTSFLR